MSCIVFDTNSLVSAVLHPYKKTAVVQAYCLARERCQFAFSKETFTELEEVIMRDKFEPYFERELRLKFFSVKNQIRETKNAIFTP